MSLALWMISLVTKKKVEKVTMLSNKCLHCILNISWSDVITKKELWKRTNHVPISHEIWITHILKKQSFIEKDALNWKPQDSKKLEKNNLI